MGQSHGNRAHLRFKWQLQNKKQNKLASTHLSSSETVKSMSPPTNSKLSSQLLESRMFLNSGLNYLPRFWPRRVADMISAAGTVAAAPAAGAGAAAPAAGAGAGAGAAAPAAEKEKEEEEDSDMDLGGLF